jgi:PTH1 family peptidyl-tRNA hydrolase
MSWRLVCGLGNPGRHYRHTRHNVGFMVADEMAHRLGVAFRLWHRDCFLAEAGLNGEGLLILKPLTFVNLSGIAVSRVLVAYHATVRDLLVLCDDAELPFGKLRLRSRGSSGGHQGLASIASHIESTQFSRLRIGIGRPPGGEDLADYVLSEFDPHERRELPTLIQRAADAALLCIREGVEWAMNKINA